MKKTITDLLRCPVCGESVACTEDGKSLRCHGARVHCFDFSRSGYLNLAGPHAGAGDLKEAVRARSLFLESGYYEPLSKLVNSVLAETDARTVLDAGCGEGYYTNRMAGDHAVLGIDLSSAGIDHAAKQAKREETGAGFVVGSIFKLPVADASFDAVTNLFAPCAEEEFSRVLKDGASLIVVAAGERHLFGLKQVLYDDPYLNPGRADLPQHMECIREEHLTYEITVEGQDRIEALFSMTPYYWRTSERDHARLRERETLTTTVDFTVYLYRKGTKE